MKTRILSLAIALVSFMSVSAQTLIAEEKGVSLSYTVSFYNSINCGSDKLDQYKITAYLENNSGHTIYRQQSYVRHSHHQESAGCASTASADFYGKDRWPDNSTETKTYYVLVRKGEKPDEPSWALGSFRFLD